MANSWLEDQEQVEQRFLYNGIHALQQWWNKSLSGAGHLKKYASHLLRLKV